MRFIINTSLKSNSKEKTKKKEIRKKQKRIFLMGKKQKIEKNKKQVLIKVAVFPSCRPMELCGSHSRHEWPRACSRPGQGGSCLAPSLTAQVHTRHLSGHQAWIGEALSSRDHRRPQRTHQINTTGHSVMHSTEKINEDAVTASSGGAASAGVVKEGLPEEVTVQRSPEGLGASRGKVCGRVFRAGVE